MSDSPLATASPRRTRSINRKRMSLGYIKSPNNDSNASPAPSTPGTPSSSASRPFFTRSNTRPLNLTASSESASSSHNNSFSLESTGPATPRSETPNPFSPPSYTSSSDSPTRLREDGQTVMDLSKSLLAEIAQRQRRIGELKEELKNQEAALKTLHTAWQASVSRDLAIDSTPASPSLAKLRAPRQRPPIARSFSSASRATPEPATASTDSASTSIDQINSTDTADSDVSIPAGMADALRGFSAKLPAGWGGQLNSLLDGLNAPPTQQSTPRPQGLDVLDEEAEAPSDSPPHNQHSSHTTNNSTADVSRSSIDTTASSLRRSIESSASSSSRPPTTHRAKTGSSLFGSFSLLKEQFEDSLKGTSSDTSPHGRSSQHSGTISIDGLPGLALDSPQKTPSSNSPHAALKTPTGGSTSEHPEPSSAGWSTWGKRFKDAAARAEKALGDAMALPEDAHNASSSSRPDNDAKSPTETTNHLRPAASTSSRRNSTSPTSLRPSFDFDGENQREKTALAELELGWLSNLMPSSASHDQSPSIAKRSPSRVLRDGDKPKQLTAAELLALEHSDGLVRENIAPPSHRSTSVDALDGSQRKSNAPRPLMTKSSSTSVASKRNSMAANANNFLGILSSAWGSDKMSDQFDSIPEDRPPQKSNSSSRSPSPRAADAQKALPPFPQSTRRSSSSASNPSSSSTSSSRLQQRLRDAASRKELAASPTSVNAPVSSPPAPAPISKSPPPSSNAWDWTVESDSEDQEPDAADRTPKLSEPIKPTPPNPQQASPGETTTGTEINEETDA